MTPHQNSGQAIDDQNSRDVNVETQEEIRNQASESLSSSSSSPAIWPVTETAETPGDVASGSVLIDQRVGDLTKNFWGFYSKWINETVREVRFPFRLVIFDVTHF